MTKNKLKILLYYTYHQIFHNNENPYFNKNNYVKKYTDIKNYNKDPFIHFLLHGIDEGRTDNYDINVKSYDLVKKSKLFDYDFYTKNYNLTCLNYNRALLHYLEVGYKKGYNPSKKFNGNNYLKKYPDVKQANINPLVHYLKYGKKEEKTDKCDINTQSYQLVKQSKLFDYRYYIKQRGEGFHSPHHALLHYLEIGYKKGYNPSKKFNGNNYLKKYPDVKQANINPLVHYLKYGKKEEKTDKCGKITNEYCIAKESGLYDHEYYMKKCKKGFNSYRQGLLHYLEIGFKKGYNPGPYFDGRNYLKKYPDVKKSEMNPLIHFLKYGIHEKRFGLTQISYKNFNDEYNVKNILNKLNQEINIIIQINNINNLEKCIQNIINTTNNRKIFLINPENHDIDFSNIKNIENTIIINEKNLGCLMTKISRENENDIIFLKDNILVFNKWLQKLITAAYSKEKIGFVFPISNNSPISLMDLDNSPQKNNIIINSISKKEYMETPMPNDSFIYIKHELFKELNIESEDNILNFYHNAIEKGWVSILDESTYVHFKPTKILNNENIDIIDEYDYENQLFPEFVNSNTFKRTYENIKNSNIPKNNIKKNILFTLHNGGGVEFTIEDISKSICDEYNTFILKAYEKKLILYTYMYDEITPIKEFTLSNPWHSKIIHNDEYTQIYFYILINYNIDIIQMEHFIFHSFDLAKIGKQLNIPTILTIHDFYLICPTYFLLDENYEYCGGYCENKFKNCSTRVLWFDLPRNIVEWKKIWQKYVYEILFKNVDAIVTATSFTKNMFLEHYPQLNNEDITLIEHGRDLIKYDNFNTTPNKYQKIKILIPGNISQHKGSEYIKELKKMDLENRLELHYIGVVDKELQEIGTYHGKYTRDEFSKFVSKIKPSFIGIFSICAETYSHTLTESFNVGVPILATNIGALKTRIEKNGGGWLVDYKNPKSAYQKILEISINKEEYKRVKKEVDSIKTTSLNEMGDNYKKLYKKLGYKEEE